LDISSQITGRKLSVGVSKSCVLMIGPTPPPAHGVSVFTATLLGSCLKDSFRVVHLDISDRRSIANIGRFEFVNLILAFYHGLKFQWMLVRERPQLIYLSIAETTFGFLRDSLFLVPARLFGLRVVAQFHGGYFDTLYANANLPVRFLMRFSLGRVRRAIVLGDAFRKKLEGLVSPERIRVVPIGIRSDIFEAAKCGTRTPRNGTHTVLYLGSLVESKGFIDLLHAVPYVLHETKDVQFVFVGDSSLPEAKAGVEWCKEQGIDGFVKFMGAKWGPEKIGALLAADTFAFPTWYPLEGQPIVLLEAMSAGLPILTTRHATIPDVLGEDGAVYVNKKDPEDIAAKLCGLLKDEDLRAKMGQLNQKKFLQFHTVESFSRNMQRVFEEALCSS
jgi:glycosyltransferase involved in cell wall biosynthesis